MTPWFGCSIAPKLFITTKLNSYELQQRATNIDIKMLFWLRWYLSVIKGGMKETGVTGQNAAHTPTLSISIATSTKNTALRSGQIPHATYVRQTKNNLVTNFRRDNKLYNLHVKEKLIGVNPTASISSFSRLFQLWLPGRFLCFR